MSKPLYAQSREVAAIMAAIDEAEGAITPELEARLDAALPNYEAKIGAILKHVRNYCARADAADEEIQRLTKYRNAERNKERKWKAYILHNMLSAQLHEVDCGYMGKPRVHQGRTKVDPASLDLDRLPPGFVEETRKAKVGLIKKALESGEDVPGARLTRGEPYLTGIG